jgi:hypothetical protein
MCTYNKYITLRASPTRGTSANMAVLHMSWVGEEEREGPLAQNAISSSRVPTKAAALKCGIRASTII